MKSEKENKEAAPYTSDGTSAHSGDLDHVAYGVASINSLARKAEEDNYAWENEKNPLKTLMRKMFFLN